MTLVHAENYHKHFKRDETNKIVFDKGRQRAEMKRNKFVSGGYISNKILTITDVFEYYKDVRLV